MFMMNALLFGLWVTRLPEVKVRLDLSEGELGILLFFLPFGSFIAFLVVPRWIRRYGAGTVTSAAAAVYATLMLFPLLISQVEVLGVNLLLIGFSSGVMGIAMNAAITVVERRKEISVMATSHGFWSLGGLAGAGFGSLALLAGWPAWLPSHLVIALAAGMILWTLPVLRVTRDQEAPRRRFVWPPRRIWGLAFIGFFTMMGEGAMADWSGIYLQQVAMTDPAWVGFGYTSFALAMTIGRFYGDTFIARVGAYPVILFGGALTATGLGLVLFGETLSSLLGFFLVGIGYSCSIPVVISESARSDPGSPARGISAVVSVSNTGFLLGPALIGLMAEQWSLRLSMAFLLATALITILITFRGRR